MLATSHIALNAATMFQACDSTRIQLPSLALYSSTRLTNANTPSAANSTGSRFCIRRCFICLAFILSR